MDASQAIDLARQAVMLTLVVAAPVLLVGLIVAAVVGVLQAATQVQEQTLSFVPKMAAMVVTALLVGPWMLSRVVEFAKEMFSQLP
ncbi:MAG: flagellar biosynthesis protein FliQ [Phycisphaerae bacterium]|nr:flagellar biosynthesis protein FliQ [Phycisphaerae bacterium]